MPATSVWEIVYGQPNCRTQLSRHCRLWAVIHRVVCVQGLKDEAIFSGFAKDLLLTGLKSAGVNGGSWAHQPLVQKLRGLWKKAGGGSEQGTALAVLQSTGQPAACPQFPPISPIPSCSCYKWAPLRVSWLVQGILAAGACIAPGLWSRSNLFKQAYVGWADGFGGFGSPYHWF